MLGRSFSRLALRLVASLACLAPWASEARADTQIQGGNLINQTWTKAASPYVLLGDVTVPVGSTLTIEPGTEIQVADDDAQGSGVDPMRVEITIRGALHANGTKDDPIHIWSPLQTESSWVGFIIDPGVTDLQMHGIEIQDANHALAFSGGTFTVDGLTLDRDLYGVFVDGEAGSSGHITVKNTVLWDDAYGLYASDALTSTLGLDIVNCTLDDGEYGITLLNTPSTIVNTIVTNQYGYGVVGDVGKTTITYSDVWSNAQNYGNISAGEGCISQNPNYVGSYDYHLQSTSVCVDAGTGSGAPSTDRDGDARPADGDGINGPAFDIGAYEYGSMPATSSSSSSSSSSSTSASSSSSSSTSSSSASSSSSGTSTVASGSSSSGGAGGNSGNETTSTVGSGGAAGGGAGGGGGADDGDSGGSCSCGVAGGSSQGAALALVALGLAFVRRKRHG